MDLSELAARESIRNLIDTYTAGVDTGKLQMAMDLFAPDATVTFAGEEYVGRAEIAKMYDANNKRAGSSGIKGRVQHFVTSTIIEVDGVRATAHSYLFVLTGAGVDHWGRYRDEFLLTDDRWLFSKRSIILDGMVPGGFGEAISKPALK